MGGDDLDFNIKFIKLVEKHRLLYDHKNEGYSNKVTQEEAWREIAEELGEDWLTCKDKWKNIRSCYTRHLRLKDKAKTPYYLAKHLAFLFPYCKSLTIHANEAPSPATSGTIVWGKVEDIEIVEEPQEDFENTVDEFRTETIYLAEDASEDDANITSQPVKQEETRRPKMSGFNKWRNKKRRGLFQEKRNSELIRKKPHLANNTNDDSDLNFFKSLLPDMRRMNSKDKNRLKINILKEIFSILYPEDAEKFLQTI